MPKTYDQRRDAIRTMLDYLRKEGFTKSEMIAVLAQAMKEANSV